MCRRPALLLLATAALAASAVACSLPAALRHSLSTAADGGDVPTVTASGYVKTGATRNRLFYVFYEAEGGAVTDDTPIIVWLEVRRL